MNRVNMSTLESVLRKDYKNIIRMTIVYFCPSQHHLIMRIWYRIIMYVDKELNPANSPIKICELFHFEIIVNVNKNNQQSFANSEIQESDTSINLTFFITSLN
ncbi:hypothetical protein BpHYR1_023436 [Brachionus plicatilis]|uniref:Uncharacterized protein n=1 Tax=Brachionus plicatilis TaxID=10195 RepID=A0A3M7Q6A4_BRAPC|nr:hypothetical protein BpHYR1_023436 [Brachionus plicatilis]